MINSVSSTAGSTSSANSVTSAASKQTEITKDAFLQLLVAQVKNQDPMSPQDGTQFLSQLAQFTELEQMIGIRSEVADLNSELTTKAATTTQAASGSTSDASASSGQTQNTTGANNV